MVLQHGDGDRIEETLQWESNNLKSVENLKKILHILNRGETLEWGIYIVADQIEHTGIMLVFDRNNHVETKVVCIDVSGGSKVEKWGPKKELGFPFAHLEIIIDDWSLLCNLDLYILQEVFLPDQDKRAKARDIIEAMLVCDPGPYNVCNNNCRDHVLLVLKRLSSEFNIPSLHENMEKVIAALKEKDWKELKKRLAGFLKRR